MLCLMAFYFPVRVDCAVRCSEDMPLGDEAPAAAVLPLLAPVHEPAGGDHPRVSPWDGL